MSGAQAVCSAPYTHVSSGQPVRTITFHLSTPDGGVIQTERVMNFSQSPPMIKLASMGGSTRLLVRPLAGVYGETSS